MSDQIPVWYQLVGTDWKPFKETTVDAVLMSPNSFIFQLRDAVKTKNPNKLASIDAANLKVYKTNNLVESKKEYVEEDSILADIGISENDCLLVVVAIKETLSISITRHRKYRRSKAIQSSRSYLTTVAIAIQDKYHIKTKNSSQSATIGDVLWNVKKNPGAQPKIPGDKPLREFFSEEKWIFLESLNNAVNPELHMMLPFDNDNVSRILVALDNFSDHENTFKNIAKCLGIVEEEKHLLVKFEGSDCY